MNQMNLLTAVQRLVSAIPLFLIALAPLKGQCNFNFTPGNPCPGETVTFTVSNPQMNDIYTWDLDGVNMNNDGTGTTVTFVYPFSTSPMNYIVNLYSNGVICGNQQTVSVKAAPDPNISVTTGQTINNNIISSCNAGSSVSLGIVNASSTFNTNTGYTLNWGDGSPILSLNNSSFDQNTPLLHTYNGFGYQTITLTATNGQCSFTKTYQFFNGSNPSIGMSNPGNTVGLCAPATLTFPLANYQNNPPGTVYTFFRNTVQIASYTQATLPSAFTYTFAASSCGETTPDGQFTDAFAIKVVATNPCGTSAAIVQPVTASSTPVPDFSIQGPPNQCPDAIFTFTNTSTNIHEYNTITGMCVTTLSANWAITPGPINTAYQLTSGSLFNSDQIKVKFLLPGTYTITMTLTPTPVCGPAVITKTVTILEPPKADATVMFSNPNGCAPLTATFHNQSTGYQVNYTWTVSPATGWAFANGSTANSFEPAIIFSTSGTYTVTLSVQNVCDVDTWTTTVVVKAKPTVTLPSLGPFCQTATLNFSNQNTQINANLGTITSYMWSFPGGTPASSSSQFPTGIQYSVSAATTFSYTVTVTNECGSTTATGQFDIQVPPALSLPPDFTVCSNGAATQLMVTPSGGTWSGPGVSSGGLFNPVQAGAPGVKTLTYNYGSGVCQAQGTIQVTVVALPTVNAGADLQACVNETALTLSVATPAGGVWTSSGSGVVNGNTFNPSMSGVGSYNLTYTVTSPEGCVSSDVRVVVVKQLPVINVANATFCNSPGTVALPNATPAGGSWSGPGISGSQFDPIVAGGVGVYMATYAYTDPSTQCSNSGTSTITVINPTAINAGPDVALCQSVTAYNLDTGVTPPGGTWTTSSAGLSGNTFNANMAGPGMHTLTYTFGTGNCLVTDVRVITVNPLPVVSVGPDQKACIDNTALALSSSPAGGTWTISGSGVISGSTFNPAQSGTGTFTLTYSVTDANSCSNSDALLITVNPLPNIAVNDTTYCNAPGTVLLPAINPNGGTWSGPGISGNQFSPTMAGGIGSYQASYTYTNPSTQCTNMETISIQVINPALVSAGIDTAFCESVTVVDLSSGGASPASGGVWTTTSNGLQGALFNPNAAGPGVHTFTYSVGTGNCLVSDTRTIQVWALPPVSAGPDLSACISDSAISLSPSPAAGTWTVSPAAVLAGNSFQVNASGTGNYTLNYSFIDGHGCVNSDQTNLVVHALPVLLANDTTFCNTPGLVTLPVAAPVGGTWSGSGISGSTFDPIGAGGVGIYPATYSYTDQNSCKNNITVNIGVIDPPQVNAGIDDTLCISNGILPLTGYLPTSGGVWAGPGIANSQSAQFDPILAGGGIHFVTYSFGAGNCLVRDTAKLWVIDVPIEAGPSLVTCLDDAPLTLTGFMPAGGSWSGPGITNTSGIFSSAVATAGTATLHYDYIDPVLSCAFTDSLKITVRPMPESDFAQPSENCINQPITFDNLSQSTFLVHWSFGDGVTSTMPEPMHTYTDTGTYIITLITENQYGCQDSVKKSIFVTEPPFAFFSATPDSGCAVLHVAFMNESYGYQTTYHWNFGNGQTSNTYDPGIIDFEQGTKDTVYTIHIMAQNLCATREWTDSVKVFPWPLANFGTTLDTICTGESIGLNNITLGNPDSFIWDFGNGITSTDSLPGDVQYFTDTLYRTFVIRLIATNFCGSDTAEYPVVVKPLEVSAFFNIPSNTGCEPYTVQFTNFSTPGAGIFWDFGDGNTSAMTNPVHTFTQPGIFKVVQKASSGCGYDSTIAFITVLPAPSVSFTSAPQVCRGDTLHFTNTSASLSGTSWTFGDGDTSLLYHPGHTWQQAGNYTVTLLGISAVNGCPATISAPIKVLELPAIGFAPDHPDGCMPLTIEFSNQSLGATYFEWNFGDGNTQTGTEVQHIYNAAGQYSVHLRGIDTNGCRNDSTLNFITVYPLPSPAFSLQRDRLCGLPVTVTLSNATPDAVGYVWNFGNNTGSVDNNPQVIYSTAGDYTISLEAINTFGCRDTVAQVFSAYAIPVADFTVLPEEGCAPLEVAFVNESLNSTNALWLFSDGRQSTDFSPALTFSEAGTYDVKLIASHRDVCFDTLSLNNVIFVKPSPFANFSFEEVLTTPPSGEFQFTDLSIDATQWAWDFGDGGISDEQNPDYRYFSNGVKTVTLLVTSINGCTDDTSQTLIPRSISGLFIPNAFTPTLGNGEAAFFKPKGVGLKEYEIAVYSSFGQLLWSSDKLNEGQPSEPWDGTFKGELLPQDVYVWQVKRAIFEDGTVWEGNFDAGTGAGKWVGSVLLIR